MFSEAIWEAMFEHAEADYPAECCGIVTVDGKGLLAVHRCENIQNKLHAADPKTHPRTAKEAYMIDPMQLFRIECAAEAAGGRIVAFYHSHIDVGAYFSEKDQADAASEGEPVYPEVLYPVIPVNAGRVDRKNKKVFGWRSDAARFEDMVL